MAQSCCAGRLQLCAWVPPANWCPAVCRDLCVAHILILVCFLLPGHVWWGGCYCTGVLPRWWRHERPSFSKVAKYVQVRCQEISVSMTPQPPARVGCRPGRAGSPSNGHSLNHTRALSEENTACSGNLSSCSTSLDSSTYTKHSTRWNRHWLM